MSKIVCHMQKYKASDCGGLRAEDFRLSESINKKNPDLDLRKTGENILFTSQESVWGDMESIPYQYSEVDYEDHNWQRKMKERIDELQLGKKVRKDAVTCCSFIIGSDQEFFKNKGRIETEIFFEVAYNFFGKRYGYENIVGASVHFDEGGAPHMHLRLVPVTQDGKLSAKTLFNRQELRNLQDELPKYLNRLGYHIERGRDTTKEGKVRHLSELDYKIQEEQKELDHVIEVVKTHNMNMQSHTDYMFEIMRRSSAAYMELKERYEKLSKRMDKALFLSSEMRQNKREMELLIESMPGLQNELNEAFREAEKLSEEQKQLIDATEYRVKQRRGR